MPKTNVEIGRIENALDALLSQMLVEREGKSARAVQRIAATEQLLVARVPTPVSLANVPTRQESAVNLIVKHPVEGACRYAVRLLGERLNEILKGDANKMSEIAERVAYRNPKREGRRISILSSAWDGIGHWHS